MLQELKKSEEGLIKVGQTAGGGYSCVSKSPSDAVFFSLKNQYNHDHTSAASPEVETTLHNSA